MSSSEGQCVLYVLEMKPERTDLDSENISRRMLRLKLTGRRSML